MLFDKKNMMAKPYKTTLTFRKSKWYFFPQRWTWKKSITEMKYVGNDAYQHRAFWLVYAYSFSWLFIDFHWELKTEFLSETIVKHSRPDEPVKAEKISLCTN